MKNKLVRTVPVKGDPRIIAYDVFKTLVITCLQTIFKDTPETTEQTLRETLYPIILADLKKNNFFFPGLSFSIIWGVYKEFIQKTRFNGKTRKELEAEYDDLCWKKINDISFSEERFKALKSLFNKE